MFHSWKMAMGLLSVVVLTVGCQTQTPPPTTAATASQAAHADDDSHQHVAGKDQDDHQEQAADPKVSAALAKLSPEDQPMAKAQQFCAVMNQSRLGSMGTPLKLEIKGEPVFVCCAGCKSKALKNPDETLAKVAALKAGNKAAQ